MTLPRPKSMAELAYFTKRKLGEKGRADVWVFKEKCACGGTPKKPTLRAKEYICDACNKRSEKQEYEETLKASIAYTCPECEKIGEVQIPFVRKKVTLIKDNGKKKRVDALVFDCDCGYQFKITKKMK